MRIKNHVQEEIRCNEDLIWEFSRDLGLNYEEVKDLLVEFSLGVLYEKGIDVTRHLTNEYLQTEAV